MGKIPSWKTDNHSTNRDIPSILWNPKLHYHVHKSPPLDSALNQINPVHLLPSYFSKTRFNMFFPCTPMSALQVFWLNFWMHFSSVSCMLHDPHISGYEASHCAIFCRLSPNILLGNMFSCTPNIFSSLNEWDQVSHPYKTTCKIIFLYILVFTALDKKMNDRRFQTEWCQAIFSACKVQIGNPESTLKPNQYP
jgi:hypothetical protein